MYGVRIKTWQNSEALISNVTFQNFLLEGVYHAMAIDQTYCPSSQKVEGCNDTKGQFARVESLRVLDFSGEFAAKKDAGLKCQGCDGLQRVRVNLKRNEKRTMSTLGAKAKTKGGG